MHLGIAAVGCCTCGALALGGGAFLLRAGETRESFVAPAHDATHGESLGRRHRCCALLRAAILLCHSAYVYQKMRRPPQKKKLRTGALRSLAKQKPKNAPGSGRDQAGCAAPFAWVLYWCGLRRGGWVDPIRNDDL